MENLCLFEDAASDGFYPLTETRHVSELLVGGRTLCDRARELFPSHRVVFSGRSPVIDHYPQELRLDVSQPGERVLFLNGRVLPSQGLLTQIPGDSEWIAREGETVVEASIDGARVSELFDRSWVPQFDRIDQLQVVQMQGIHLYSWLWDLLDDNHARIAEDFLEFPTSEEPADFERVFCVNRPSISVSISASVAPGVVLDASEGPIVIASGVRVMPGAVVLGPSFIGPNSTIKVGAKIYGGTSIGPWSKVGGEVENSIILGYSNKQHDGFLGHSYLGAWVNLGADTNTSDLKNNYGTISVELDGRRIETGRMMLGTLMGDHSKTGINTMLNTGTVVGVFANVYGAGFPPKSIPSFYWGGAEGGEVYRFDAATEVAERVMARRNIPFTNEDRTLLRSIYDRTVQSAA